MEDASKETKKKTSKKEKDKDKKKKKSKSKKKKKDNESESNSESKADSTSEDSSSSSSSSSEPNVQNNVFQNTNVFGSPFGMNSPLKMPPPYARHPVSKPKIKEKSSKNWISRNYQMSKPSAKRSIYAEKPSNANREKKYDKDDENDEDDEDDDDDDEEEEEEKDDDNSDSNSDSDSDNKIKKKKKPKAKEVDNHELVKYSDISWKEAKQIDLTGKKGKKMWKKLQKKRSKKEKKRKKITKVQRAKTIVKLKKKRIYFIRMRIRNEGGWSHYSTTFRVELPDISISSKIIKTMEERELLVSWLPQTCQQRRWKLLFRASEHQFSASMFHSKCDSKKNPTFVIIETTTKHVFGGFTVTAWNQSGNYNYDQQAFIFKLREPEMKKKKSWKKYVKQMQATNGENWRVPGKFECFEPTTATYSDGGLGPAFGGGHDFYVSDMCNVQNDSSSNPGNSYSCPTTQSFLTGTGQFLVKEYEVFELVK
ncbi:hypothetical protein RFI_07052 [Reticulomyxa filosa]|uniref:TLDc domain-containing protein n=1 Tax=Reticulomyxa filosa TaxID=46433 RepID=X6NUT4_RETFI|nr:hypothetical protein RFI_07052 [Reticulomyxa filosa]|eukprot:ETO30065.1 hypothetical protein RFI_07052 [Reticulomyxa filosa]